ncbi:MAG TPA: dihydrodipicolinate synthase family protein [Acidimicrobiia bacterium]|nr:dihydrodipicolinate synthase family protein [Acidimicrobiia bacterium]
MDPVFAGVGVALVTLFDEDGEIDVPATAAHAARLVERGIRGVLVSGSTGEASALSAEERVLLLEGVRDAVPDHVPVLAGTGAPSARQAVALTLSAREHGADAVLVLSPPRVADPSSYYDVVARSAGDLPVLAYHFPKASEPGIPLEILPKLPVSGLKDSSGDPDRLLAELDWGRPVYTGSSAILSFAGPLGCAGAILALANVEPDGCIAAFAGDSDAQRRLAAAHRASRLDFPRGLKEMMAARFGVSPVCRMG